MKNIRRFDAPRFYHEVRYHMIEIGSIISLAIVIYKLVKHEW